MTTATLTAPPVRTSTDGLSRITRVVRLHTANPWTTIILPWTILVGILVANIALWLILNASLAPEDLADARVGIQYSGASTWVFVYMTVVAIQAMNLTFPLALGYGATRRDFYLGTALTFVLLSAMYAIGLTALSVIETVTDGWGLGGSMFSAPYFGGDAAWYVKLGIYFFGMLFFFFSGSVFVRWRGNGLIVTFAVILAALIGVAALITLTASWGAVGDFFVVSQALGVAAWLLVPTAISAVAAFFVLRGATPRS
jgi:hypothetical protein